MLTMKPNTFAQESLIAVRQVAASVSKAKHAGSSKIPTSMECSLRQHDWHDSSDEEVRFMIRLTCQTDL